MSNRIEQIAIECVRPDHFEIELFAKKIVEDCLKICNDNPQFSSRDVAFAIAHHFDPKRDADTSQ